VIKIDLSQFGAGELTLDQRFDGAAGYILDSMNGNRDVTGNQLDNMANSGFPTPFLKYKENGVKVELVGKEKLGDRDVFVLQVTPKQGSVSKQYFDAETYLLLKTVATVNVPQLGQDVEQIVELSDYRPVDGLKVAFALKATNPAQSYSIALGTVRHDVEIDEQMFKKP
jgi:zinc protease